MRPKRNDDGDFNFGAGEKYDSCVGIEERLIRNGFNDSIVDAGTDIESAIGIECAENSGEKTG